MLTLAQQELCKQLHVGFLWHFSIFPRQSQWTFGALCRPIIHAVQLLHSSLYCTLLLVHLLSFFHVLSPPSAVFFAFQCWSWLCLEFFASAWPFVLCLPSCIFASLFLFPQVKTLLHLPPEFCSWFCFLGAVTAFHVSVTVSSDSTTEETPKKL